jgi:hypothetical protein
MRLVKLAGALATAALLLSGCFSGTGTHAVGDGFGPRFMASGLWHSAGGPNCAFSSEVFPFFGAVPPFPHIEEPARAGPRYASLGGYEFTTSNCQPWVRAGGSFDRLYPISIYGVFLGDGDFRVGPEVPAGTYRATTPQTCNWQRVRSFGYLVPVSERYTNVIASGTSDVVEIQPGDLGFVTSGCGAWVGTR